MWNRLRSIYTRENCVQYQSIIYFNTFRQRAKKLVQNTNELFGGFTRKNTRIRSYFDLGPTVVAGGGGGRGGVLGLIFAG